MLSSTRYDVLVESFELTDFPASIKVNVKIRGESFYSRIVYHSIPEWSAIWDTYGEDGKPTLLGLIVAFDCMRFLGLGGSQLTLCKGLYLDERMISIWRTCFKKQFGEWRFLNKIEYPTPDFPALNISHKANGRLIDSNKENSSYKSLLTNGGGKDTLAGILLLQKTKSVFDLYEGYLPLGGSHALQKQLLAKLHNIIPSAEKVCVTIEDNFFLLLIVSLKLWRLRLNTLKLILW